MLCLKKKAFLYCLFNLITLTASLSGAAFSDERILSTEDTNAATNPLIVFLDDSESADKPGAITLDFASAFMQEAAPIIVSANLFKSAGTPKVPLTENPANIKEAIETIQPKGFKKRTRLEQTMLDNIIFSLIDFDAQINEKWIIKEINTSLYLLLPKKYIENKQIILPDITAYLPRNPITQTEESLGLKVNHMKTVALEEVQKNTATEKNMQVNYFTPALDDIFVTVHEYLNLNKKSIIPNWLIYIFGHGKPGRLVSSLSIDQFKDLLSFLNKIQTKALIYASCYASGTNTTLIYKDAVSGLDQTYPFTIIALALTDAPTYSSDLKIVQPENGNPFVQTDYDFNCSIKNILQKNNLNYLEGIRCLELEAVTVLENTAQIRYPGLPWFSILDTNVAVSVHSVLAKTRTAPLNITTFFSKDKLLAKPKGILLYTHTIPFELIIDTKKPEPVSEGTSESIHEKCYVPALVSMIPGDSVHYLHKISSTCNTTDAILNGFKIIDFSWHKIFMIDEVSAPLSETTGGMLTNGAETFGTLTNVVVDLTQNEFNIYFTHKEQIYFVKNIITESNPIDLASEKQKEQYSKLLRTYGKEKSRDEKIAKLHNLREHALQRFTNTIDSIKARKAVSKLLEDMPNNTAMRIPQLTGSDCSFFDSYCWLDFLQLIAKKRLINQHKLLWFDMIDGGEENKFKNVIIEITPNDTRLFTFDERKQVPEIRSSSWRGYPKRLDTDYVPAYAKKFAYFDEHMTLHKTSPADTIEATSVHEQITPSSISTLKTVLEKKPASSPRSQINR